MFHALASDSLVIVGRSLPARSKPRMLKDGGLCDGGGHRQFLRCLRQSLAVPALLVSDPVACPGRQLLYRSPRRIAFTCRMPISFDRPCKTKLAKVNLRLTAAHMNEEQNGDPGRTRTPNILIRSQVLYPVELRDRLHFRYLSEHKCGEKHQWGVMV